MQRSLVVVVALLCGHVDARLGGSGATDSGDAVTMDSLGNDWDKLITDMGDTPGNNVTDALTKLVDPPSTAKALLDVAVDKPDEALMEADVWKVTGQDFLEDILPTKMKSIADGATQKQPSIASVKSAQPTVVPPPPMPVAPPRAVAGAPPQAVLPVPQTEAKVVAEPSGSPGSSPAVSSPTVVPGAYQPPYPTVVPGAYQHQFNGKFNGVAVAIPPPPPPPATKKQPEAAPQKHLQVLDIGSPSRSSHASEIVYKVLGDKLDEANVKIAALESQLALDKKTMDTAEAKKTESQLALDKNTQDTVNAAQAKVQSLEAKEHEEEAKLAQSEQDRQGYKNQVDAIAKQLVSEHKTAEELRAKLGEGAKPLSLEVNNLRAETVALRFKLKKANAVADKSNAMLSEVARKYHQLNGRAHKIGHIAADIDESRHAAKAVAEKSNAMLSEADAMLTKVTAQNQKLKKQNVELNAQHLQESDAQKKLQALKTALEEHKGAKLALAKAEEAIREAPHGEPVDAFKKVAAEAAAVRDRSAKVIASFVKETVG